MTLTDAEREALCNVGIPGPEEWPDGVLGREVAADRIALIERIVAARLADAWDEGHQHRWRRGMDECHCGAYSSGECACGKYGMGELLSLKDNPYREDQ